MQTFLSQRHENAKKKIIEYETDFSEAEVSAAAAVTQDLMGGRWSAGLGS